MIQPQANSMLPLVTMGIILIGGGLTFLLIRLGKVLIGSIAFIVLAVVVVLLFLAMR